MFIIKPKYFGKDGVAVFTTTQIDDYGFPEENGFTGKYYVIESRELIMTPTYKEELQVLMEAQGVHRYNRLLRFKTILGQLVGAIGFVTRRSKEIVEDLQREVNTFERDFTPPCLVWETLRQVLKKNGRQIFYNRIPAIAMALNMVSLQTRVTTKQWNDISEDFQIMHEIFPRIRHHLSRKYFPNLRFVALKLLEKHGVKLNITIPTARTSMKRLLLNKHFDDIWALIYEEYSDLVFA